MMTHYLPRRHTACFLVSISSSVSGWFAHGTTQPAAASLRHASLCARVTSTVGQQPYPVNTMIKSPDTNVSSLGQIPDFRGPSRLMKDAYKQSKLIQVPKLANGKKRAIKRATLTIDAYTRTLSMSLKAQLTAFRDVLDRLSPFEAQLSELTLAALEREGGKPLKDVIHDFDQFRRAVVRAGKESCAAAVKAETTKQAVVLMEAGVEHVGDVCEEECEALYQLIRAAAATAHCLAQDATLRPIEHPHHLRHAPASNPHASGTAQNLRRLPRPVLEEPVLVLVGMPNVGKSSLVTVTSTGTPEINDYPFTTRRLKLGHVEDKTGARYQVMDTPGVLSRPEDERNPMEGLTLAAVEHLPSAVVYVMDLSGTCGTQSAPELQLQASTDPFSP